MVSGERTEMLIAWKWKLECRYVEIMCIGDIRLDTRMEVVGKWRFFFFLAFERVGKDQGSVIDR